MKHFVLCLALLCGVALCNNFTNTTDPLCALARANITNAEKALQAQKSKLYPDNKEIANLEANIALNRGIANQTCAPAQICTDAKSDLAKARSALDAQKSRLYPEAKVIAILNGEIAMFKDQINANCAPEEVCSNAKAEIDSDRKKIIAEKSKLYPDAKVIAILEEDMASFKRIIMWRCPANQTCALAKEDFQLARSAITTERSKLYPDTKRIATLETEVANATSLIINSCIQNETCAFIHKEIQRVEAEIKTEKGRLYPDRNVIAKREAELSNLNQIQATRCSTSSGIMRLAEVAIRGGRFLAKLLRH